MRLFTSILLLSPFILLRAQNSLHLYSHDAEPFQVFIGDSLVNQKAQPSLSIHGIRKDTLLLKIKMEGAISPAQTIYLLYKGNKAVGLEHRYLIERRNQQIQLSYQGISKHIPPPEPLVPPKPVLDTSGKYKNSILGNFCELRNGKPFFTNNVPQGGACTEAMPETYMNYLKILMQKESLEDRRMHLASETTRNNCVSVSQLNTMLSYLSYDIEKLKLVKKSYARIADKQNSSRLDSTFKLESSLSELRKFLQTAATSKSTLVNCPMPAKTTEMEELFNRVASGSSDAEKLKLLKKHLAGFCLTLSQIRPLVNLFAHEEPRLEAAKELFMHCSEKQNYEKMAEVFSQKKMQDELHDFLRLQY